MTKSILLLPIMLFLILGCSQESKNVQDTELHCTGIISINSLSNPESNIKWGKSVAINFNFKDSKIFYPYELLYLSIPLNGVKCHKEDGDTYCDLSEKKDSSTEHMIFIKLQKNNSIEVIDTLNENNQDRKTTYSGTCEKITY